ncbi:MAG: M16 family metallopeptidase [Polyangiaceae bacterium]
MRPRSSAASVAARTAGLLALVVAAMACGGGRCPAPLAAAPVASASTAPPPAPKPAADLLGPRPLPGEAPLFVPPSPAVIAGPAGVTIWLLERHELPLVSCDLTVTSGASSDSKGKGGLAYATARMLFEGAGARGAIDLAAAVDQLGARITTDSNADASFVSVTVLRRNLEAAFGIFGDVVVRPRFEASEFKRMKDLWLNELDQRKKDPDATARVVYRAVLFGPDSPYGHPWDGTTDSARAVQLEDVKRFYATAWRPDRATLVCVGDVTPADLSPLVQSALGSWKAPKTPAEAPLAPGAPKGPWPKLVLVDRPDAPQAVIASLGPGIAASDPRAPALWRVNDAIGGSFTSRLNQDLREKRGYTYGARSKYSLSRGVGQLVSWANVVTNKTGEALKAMLGDLTTFADQGLTEEEVDRTRSQARGEVVATYQSNEGIAAHLAADASLGLPPDWSSRAAKLRDEAPKSSLDALAKDLYDPKGAVVVVVGPRASVGAMLVDAGMPTPDMRDADGRPVAGSVR